MSKKALSVTATFIFLFSAAGATHAQKEAVVSTLEISNETPKIKSDFSSTPKTKIEPVRIFKREFKSASATEKNLDKKSARQTSAYVRPTAEQRRRRYLSDAFGVPAVIGSTFGAVFGQIANDPPEWGKNIGGFGKRFASNYATNAVRNTVSYGLSEAFKLDNRFEKSGQENLGRRLKHVFVGSYTTRTVTGKRVPDFPFVAGTYTASIVANEVWFPNRFGYKDGLRDGTISLGIRFGVNLLREFVFPK